MDHPYAKLTPDFVLDAIESTGLRSDTRIFPLNSYENRVYQVGIEDQAPVIGKFYRPGRWTTEAILEEHQFTQQLQDHDISVVPPLALNGQTLHEFNGFRFALFKRQGGYAPEVDIPETLFRIGRNIGRIHQTSGSEKFLHRRNLSIADWGVASSRFLIDNECLPKAMRSAYQTLSEELINKMTAIWKMHPVKQIKLHGDCHLGNILWRDELAYFVDFDDCCNGPAIQDIWLLLSGDRIQQTQQLMEFIEGYEEFCEFDPRQLNLVETLRTLRMMHYAAWLARRWKDPAFPMYFPWFNTEQYWMQHLLELREQFAQLSEPPLQLYP